MGSQVKFYARNAYMKGINMSGSTRHIFDSDFRFARIDDSFFIRTNFNNCDMARTRFYNVSFEDGFLYRLVTEWTEFELCDFTKTIMNGFTFDSCIFRGCDFTRCNMEDITFKSCDFIECNFRDATLPEFFYPRQMTNCKNLPYRPMACPEEGEFIGYKIASTSRVSDINSFISRSNENHGPANVLVTLKIPAEAKRSSAGGRKCRCDKAEVIGLEHIVSHKKLSVAISKYDIDFIYRIGEKISVPDFDENRWAECSTGIHFFINRKEALQYYDVMEEYYGRKQC